MLNQQYHLSVLKTCQKHNVSTTPTTSFTLKVPLISCLKALFKIIRPIHHIAYMWNHYFHQISSLAAVQTRFLIYHLTLTSQVVAVPQESPDSEKEAVCSSSGAQRRSVPLSGDLKYIKTQSEYRKIRPYKMLLSNIL